MFSHRCAEVSIPLILGGPEDQASRLRLSRAHHPNVVVVYVCHRQQKVRRRLSRYAYMGTQCNLWVNHGARQQQGAAEKLLLRAVGWLHEASAAADHVTPSKSGLAL